MVQHTPWVGSRYEEGIESQRICILGYSHWLEEGEKDSDDFTNYVLKRVLDGTWKNIEFFNRIKGYFEFTDHKAFWERVIFLNYMPECIGGPNERYYSGTEEQIKRAKARFQELIRKERPHKVFVFSKRAWSTFPMTREEDATGKDALVLDPQEFPQFSWGTYDAGGGHVVMAFGLRHPQYALGQPMHLAVRHILNKPLVKRASN